VYGWLFEIALTRATALVWLDLAWTECREGLLQRGLRRGVTLGDQEALLAWADAYWARTTPSSFAGHARLYDALGGDKTHLQTRAEVSAFSLETLRGDQPRLSRNSCRLCGTSERFCRPDLRPEFRVFRGILRQIHTILFPR
jgi:hypothetical protein